MRHIAWFTEAPIAPCPEGGLTSPQEDVRRRCLVPARAIEETGVGCSVFGNLGEADPVHVGQHLQKIAADIVVIGKISDPSRLKLARAAKHLGCYVVVDCGADEDKSEDFTQLLQLADQAVAGTPEVAAAVGKITGSQVPVIPDCGGEPEQAAKLWLDCLKNLEAKPPAGANQN